MYPFTFKSFSTASYMYSGISNGPLIKLETATDREVEKMFEKWTLLFCLVQGNNK